MSPVAHYNTVHEIEAANVSAGYSFFTPAIMRSFASRILPGVIGGRYFVSSERGPKPKSRQRYTIREALPCGRIRTVGEFGAHATAAHARRAARELVARDGADA
jgi:hypothetical protein